MSFEDVRSTAAMAGLAIFIVLFAGVLIYTFWPSNQARFDKAGRIPLEDDPDESAARGEHGR
jgi:cytochrome c oxidase cbb3-type subunit IV